MFKILTKLILGTSLLAAFFPPGVPSVAPFPVSGSKSVGYAPIVQADGTTVSWASPGGGGSTITTPDGTTTVTQLTSFNPVLYGANPSPRQTLTAGTENSGSTAIDVTTGQGAYFKAGQDVVIRGAGAAHQWAAVTPSIGGVGRGGQAVVTCDTGTDEITITPFNGYSYNQATSCNAANGQAVVFYTDGAALMTVSGTPLVEGTTYYLGAGSLLNSYKVYTSSANAIAGTSALNFDGAGSADISMAFTGTTTMSYYMAGDSGNLGLTVASSAPSFTTSSATLNAFSYNVIWWDKVVDGSSNEVNGYHFWVSRDGATEHYLTRVNRVMNAMKVTCQAGGYTNFAPTDIGKIVLAGGSYRGQLEWYDNATRTLIISQDRAGDYAYPAAATIVLYRFNQNGGVTQCGEGTGTVTGTSSHCYVLRDYGDVAWGDYKAHCFHTGVEQQKLQISGTPSSGTYYVCLYGEEQAVAYNASSATLQTAIRKLPRCGGVTVTTDAGSAPNITHLIKFFGGAAGDEGMGDVPEIEVRNYMGTPPVGTLTVATTVPGCNTNPGDVILEPPDSSGAFYECEMSPGFHAMGDGEPSWDSDLNDITSGTGHGQSWRRRNQAFPVTKPAAAVADALYTRIDSVSSDTLNIATATSTTISAGASVWPNSLPALQRTWDAIIANKGGMVDLPPGHYSMFSGTHAKTEWIGAISGGDYCFFETVEASGTHRLPLATGWRGREATICWRPSEVECYRDYYEGTDFIKAQAIFNFVSNDSFNWDVKTIYVAPSGEPKGNSINAEHSCQMFTAAGGGGDYEDSARVTISGAEILGFPNALGTFETGSYANTVRHEVFNSRIQYGGGGHDAAANSGTFTDTTFEGTNSQYRSTAIYTGNATALGLECNNVRFIEPGNDGAIRGRCGTIHLTGGSIFLSDTRTNARPMLIEDTCHQFMMDGVEVTGVGVRCDSFNEFSISAPAKISNCITRNCTFAITAANCQLNDNTGYITNATRANSAPAWIYVSNVTDATLEGNTLYQTNFTTGSGDRCGLYGLIVSGANATRIKSVGNRLNAGRCGIQLASSFVGTFDDVGSEFRGYDVSGDNAVNDFSAGNGAVVKLTGTHLSTLNSVSAWPNQFQGASSAKYHLLGCTLDAKTTIAAALTGTDNRFENCKFPNATAAEFLDVGTKIIECEFAVEPTLTGLTRCQRGNSVAGVFTKAVTLSGSQNDYAWPTICDTILVDANGSYSITGIVPLAKGVTVNIINVDASDTLTLSHNSGSSSAGNKLNLNAGSDFVEGANDGKQLIFTGGASLGATEN